MRRAIVIGGTGLVGRAVARRLLAVGWTVDLAARWAERVPGDLFGDGVRFCALDRNDHTSLDRLVGNGADLVVDCACFTAADARGLLPVLPSVGSTVMISAKAVYLDATARRPTAPARLPPSRSCSTMAPDHRPHR